MPLVTSDWEISTQSPTSVSLHLQDNQPSSNWEITSFQIDGGADVKADVSPLVGTHSLNGDGDWVLTLDNTIALGGTGALSLDVQAADVDGNVSTASVNFSYNVPQFSGIKLVSTTGMTHIRLVGTTGMSRIRMTHSGSV